MFWLLLLIEMLFETIPTYQLLYQMSLPYLALHRKLRNWKKRDAKEPGKFSSLSFLIPGQTPVPALPTIQLTCQQFNQRYRCVMRVAANVKLGNPSSLVSKHLYFWWQVGASPAVFVTTRANILSQKRTFFLPLPVCFGEPNQTLKHYCHNLKFKI